MKSLYLYTILFLFSLSSFAQKIRFTDPGNLWVVEEDYTHGSSMHTYYYTYWYGADTSIGGTTYKKLLCSDSSRGYVREDTNLRIVFYYDMLNAIEDTLYNYNMHVGGSITYNSLGITLSDNDTYNDSILVNNIYHTQYNFTCDSCPHWYYFGRSYSVLEGIGCLSSPLYPATVATCEISPETWHYNVVCFSQNGVSPSFTIINYGCGGGYLSNPANCFPNSVTTKNVIKERVNVYPIPFDRDFVIEWQTLNDLNIGVEATKISICDAIGRKVYEAEALKQNGLLQQNIHLDMPVGVYYLEMQDAGGTRAIKKIVRQ